MTEQNPDLQAFVQGLIAKGKKEKREKRKPKSNTDSFSWKESHKLLSSKWDDESIVLLINHVICNCGETYTSPHHTPFLKRTHKTYGTHLEAINYSLGRDAWVQLPKRMEHVYTTAHMCQACFKPEHLDFRVRQMEFTAWNRQDFPDPKLWDYSKPYEAFDEEKIL